MSTPSERVLSIYQAGGFFENWTVEDLGAVPRRGHPAEGPLEEGDNRYDSYRHILEGGKVLATPNLNTLGAKLLFSTPHRPINPSANASANSPKPSEPSVPTQPRDRAENHDAPHARKDSRP